MNTLPAGSPAAALPAGNVFGKTPLHETGAVVN